jgi:hypothetical protein
MSTPLEVKLRQAALADPSLTALLGLTGNTFRWYSVQLYEGSAYPAVTCHQISSVPVYSFSGRNPLARARVQFTIWEGQTPDDTNSVLDALRSFLDTFSAVGNPTQFPNQIVAELDGLYPNTQPGIYQTIVDAMIYNSDSL